MKENDIRPNDLFEKYVELCTKDSLLFDFSKFEEVSCPACKSENKKFKFLKNNFTYKSCENCGSVFCSPRPGEKELHKFYYESEASRYWANVFIPAMTEIRIEKLFRKKAVRMIEIIDKYNLKIDKICDVGAGSGILLDELRALRSKYQYYAIEPGMDFADVCRKKGYTTIEDTLENVPSGEYDFDLIISQEVIEHISYPQKFIYSMNKCLKPGGYCLVTGLGYEGFDILSLQEKSKCILPPPHLNFLSIKGFETIFTMNGFEIIDIQTPGELDVDIVANSKYCSEFVKVLINRGSDCIEEFQKFLNKYKLSSHVWIFARKLC